MADWKYGTVLHRVLEGKTYVMVVGQNGQSTPFDTTDGNSDVREAQWIGLTLRIPHPGEGAWGEPGDTTWLLGDEWEIVDD